MGTWTWKLLPENRIRVWQALPPPPRVLIACSLCVFQHPFHERAIYLVSAGSLVNMCCGSLQINHLFLGHWAMIGLLSSGWRVSAITCDPGMEWMEWACSFELSPWEGNMFFVWEENQSKYLTPKERRCVHQSASSFLSGIPDGLHLPVFWSEVWLCDWLQ